MKQLLHNEQIIMQYIWEMGDETPLRQLLIDINQRYDKDWKRTTIRTYLTQLQEKGLIERRMLNGNRRKMEIKE